MNIFKEIKEYLTALQAAEQYGIKINRNKMACCPFHDDHHPSMKIDQNYYCFACGAKGDVIDFTSRLFGISQFEYLRFEKAVAKYDKNPTSELLDLSNEVTSETASVYMEIGIQVGVLLMMDVIKNVNQ